MGSKRSKMTQSMNDDDQPDANGGLSQDSEESASESESEEESETESDSESNTVPAHAGVIQNLSLKNFMCHDSFELTLGPRLNFIIGRNGSGKSAIITGISVGLGAKASDTSRGTSLKDLIKDGKSTARVLITFRNEGIDAYYPEKYGNKITIERKLVRTGAGTYSVLDSNNKTFSTKKATIDEILLKYNIRVDNPLSFLSQDRAREFLTLTSDVDKFDYFMQGVLVTDIVDNYRQTSAHVNEVHEKLNMAKTQHSTAKDMFNESARAYERFKQSDNLRQKLELINGKIFWYNVSKIEAGIKRQQDSIAQQEQEIQEINDSIEQKESQKETLSTQRTEEKALLDDYSVQAEEIQRKIDSNYREMNNVKPQLQEVADEIKKNELDIKNYRSHNESLAKDIKKEQKKIDIAKGGTDEDLRNKTEELRSKIDQLKNQKQNLDDKFLQLSDDSEDSELASKQREVEVCLQSIRQLEEKIVALKDARRDKYIPWGGNIKRLVDEMHSLTLWHQKPLGPIGSLINVKSEFEDWKDLINAVLSRTLDSFLVYDEHDRKILSNLLRKYGVFKNIITRKFETFSYEVGKSKDNTTLVDMLNFEDENILYTLIDLNSIEKSIITEDYNSAIRLVSTANVMNVYSKSNRTSGTRTSGNQGNIANDPVLYNLAAPHKLSAHGADIEKQIQDSEAQKKSEMTRRSNLAKEFHAFKVQVGKDKKNIQKEIQTIDAKIHRYNKDILELRDAFDNDTVSNAIDTLNAQVEENNEQITNCENIILSLSDDVEKLRKKYANVRKADKELKGEKQKIDELIGKTGAKTQRLGNKMVSLEAESDKLRLEISKKNALLERHSLKVEEYTQKLTENKTRAEESCPREEVVISPEDTPQSIQDEYRATQKAVEEAEQSVGNFEEIQAELLENNRRSNEAQETMLNLEKIYGGLHSDLEERLAYLRKTLEINIHDAASSFEDALIVRNYRGKLIVDTAKRRITMLVAPNESTQRRTVDSLSGGEKSFTQVAFLLSIWKIMNSKVRGLDEFDVFMDSVNRTVSIKLLLEELRKVPHSQTIFITPQDITTVGDLSGTDVKIHRMSDPRSD